MVDSTEERSGKYDVVVLGAGDYYSHLRRGKSRMVEALKNDPRFNVIFMTPDEVVHRRLPDLMVFDEMTTVITEPMVAEPLTPRPKPYWRQGERW